MGAVSRGKNFSTIIQIEIQAKKRSLKKKRGRFLCKMGSLNLIQKFNSLFRFAIKSIDLWLLVNQSVTFIELLLWNNWLFHLTACQWLSTSIFIETAPSTWKCELHFIYWIFFFELKNYGKVARLILAKKISDFQRYLGHPWVIHLRTFIQKP